MTQPGHMYTKVLLLRAPNRIGRSLWGAGVYGFNKAECNVQDIMAFLCIFENLKGFFCDLLFALSHKLPHACDSLSHVPQEKSQNITFPASFRAA